MNPRWGGIMMICVEILELFRDDLTTILELSLAFLEISWIVWQHLYFRGHFLLKASRCSRYVEGALPNRKIQIGQWKPRFDAFKAYVTLVKL